MNKLPARTGWIWLKQGIGLFRKQPAALTTLLFANILISIGISAIPFIGPMLAVVLIPSFSMALMQACLMIEHGQRVTPVVLLTGFRKPAVFALCKVGLIYLAVWLLLALLARVVINETFWEQVAMPVDPKTAPVMAASDLIGMLFIFVLNISAAITLSFAGPLAYWQKMGPGKATFYSFFAVLRAARAFLVLLLSWWGVFLATGVVAAMIFGNANVGRVVIMWIIFLFVLLLQCAMYAAYRQIFGVPEAAPKVDVRA
jgi:hypothetical protein